MTQLPRSSHFSTDSRLQSGSSRDQECADGRHRRAGEHPSSDSVSNPEITGKGLAAPDPASDTAAPDAAEQPLPPAPSEPVRVALPGLDAGGSLERILQKRLDQINRGHTPEADRDRPLFQFTSLLRAWAIDADREAHRPRGQREEADIRHSVEHLAATALATLDRLDMENDNAA